jgi:CDP-diacylglycerol--serine O-phosphatidyltransferase
MSETLPQGPGESRWRRRRRRRRRSAAERRRGLTLLLPSLLTTGNLAAGFWSITLATSGNLERAALAIVIAGVFDALDGRVARLAKATSRFGAEYDSIADTVSFGVAPAILAYHAGSLPQLGWTGWVLAFVYTACAGLRLARFNVTPGRYASYFDGLPSPPAAGMMLSSVWFGIWLREHDLTRWVLPAPIAGAFVVLVGVLMVSPIPYRNFKQWTLRPSFGTLASLVIAALVILSEPYVTLFLLGIAYLSSGPIEWAWRRRVGKPIERLPLHDSAHGEPALAEPHPGGPA